MTASRMTTRRAAKNIFFAVCGCCVLGALMFINFFHLPQLRETAAAQIAVESARAEVAVLQSVIARHENTDEWRRETETLRHKAQLALPSQTAQSDFIVFLQSAALRHNMRLVAVQPQKPHREADVLFIPIKLKMSGSYFDLINFLQTLQDGERFVTFDGMAVKSVGAALDITLDVTIYALDDEETNLP